MTETTPLPQRILDAAEEVLRRHGAEKANVVDVARVLGMSHANIYRHFASKKALLDAVANRWLEVVTGPLEKITSDRDRSAAERLEAWFDTLRAIKRRKFKEDPELFQVYQSATKANPEAGSAHVSQLHGQLERILADGARTGEFPGVADAAKAARSFLQATVYFHHPALVIQGPVPTEADARAVFALLLAGLRAGAPDGR